MVLKPLQLTGASFSLILLVLLTSFIICFVKLDVHIATAFPYVTRGSFNGYSLYGLSPSRYVDPLTDLAVKLSGSKN